ncbi:MAG: hydroxymethylbilane synthase [Gemmatimonadales bacterium]
MRLRLGTRGSRLALAQARAVEEKLRAGDPSLQVEIVEIHTSGDSIQDVPLGPSLGQAFFTKEIEDALLAGRVDLAVHSCKDLATTLPPGLCIAAVPEREDPRDALVGPTGGLRALRPGARVGTSSPRRKRFLSALRPDLEVADMRGNVPTRVAAVDEGRFDAALLAVAGLRRLGLEGRVSEVLDPDLVLPAAGQGALAVEAREEDARVREALAVIENAPARSAVTAERACLRRLGAGCQAPVGALAETTAGALRLRAAVALRDRIHRVDLSGSNADAEALGTAAAEALLARTGLPTLRGIVWAPEASAKASAP